MDEKTTYRVSQSQTENEIRKMFIGLAVFVIILLALTALILLNAQKIAMRLPFSAEKRFIAPYEEFITDLYGETAFPERTQHLQSLADELAIAIELPEDYEIHVHYIDGPTKNAFATLGGHIFIYSGLIEDMPNENSLAMVMAHEIAHIKHRDPVAALGRGFAIQILYGFITNDYSSTTVTDFGSQIGLNFFSRTQEEKADIAALDALYLHYGHVAGATTFFQQIADDAQEDNMPIWLSTHPDLIERIDYIKETATQKKYGTGEPMPLSSVLQNQEETLIDSGE